MTKRALYISFDGLSDPLGQSQILPYITGIAKGGFEITVLSCEKKQRLLASEEEIRKQLTESGITWRYIYYDESGNIFSRWKYLKGLSKMAEEERKKHPLVLVHCRSYLASLIGLRFKKKYGLPFVFDMRGLWADERVDGGLWNLRNPIYFFLYRFFKSKEKAFVTHSDAIVSLTQKGILELQKLYPSAQVKQKSSLIPCCCNTSLFDGSKYPGGPEKEHTIVYTGSIGTWYYTREMIDCLRVWKKKIPDLRLLVLTKDIAEFEKILEDYDGQTRNMVTYYSAEHKQIPVILSKAKAAIFFIKPSYSKLASSPTKMAECWAMDLPIITNAGVGDNNEFFKKNRAGVLLQAFNEDEYLRACKEYLGLAPGHGAYRHIALESFDNRMAIKKYLEIYLRLSAPSTI